MPEANARSVTRTLQDAIAAQEKVKQAARDAAAKANPQESSEPVTPAPEPKR